MAPNMLDTGLNALLFLVPLAHLLLAPHTKVEESFNLQAAHDILVYGTPTTAAALAARYDHFSFPGAVPRTFVGAVALAALAQPLVARVVGFDAAQLVVRLVLGAANAACLLVFRRALDDAFGVAVGRWWLALSVAQFHVMFYLSRTLPNMYSFGLTTLASAFLLPKSSPARARARQRQALLLLTLSAAVFRSETAILLATTSCWLLLRRRARARPLAVFVAGLAVAAVALTVPVDTYFWQRPVWPELAAFYFNAVQGSASAWGTEPWHYYFTSALPRLLLNPLAPVLVAVALLCPATAGPAVDLVGPGLAFVAIYSAQPHKEARFVFYVVPPLTAAAALGANYVFVRRGRSRSLPRRVFARAVLPLSVVVSLAASAGMLLVSCLNYPGGDAVAQLFRLTAASSSSSEVISVHADVLTCMTGLTLFGQNPHGLPIADLAAAAATTSAGQPLLLLPANAPRPLLLFDKTEDEARLASAELWARFDYVLVEDPAKIVTVDTATGGWDALGVVHGYAGVEVLRPGEDDDDDDDDGDGVDDGEYDGSSRRQVPVLGRGAVVRRLRRWVRSRTGGWYVGPRMAPRIFIMRRRRAGQERSVTR